ncbi:hypothetical protein AAL_06148 [Moelleriella libera RCEF 2490]|uniref:Uncharacterized protein n=1 Tax=Moelleriella libera RCEF 2490 TaxID=1081109 RepID=A0A167ZDP2_9HYPO|nr:hypothetical protein AAL_06148 [Moelleriella libera RCEF 2490]
MPRTTDMKLMHVKVALKTKGIDKLLDEAREDNKENDARLLAPKSEEDGHLSRNSRQVANVLRRVAKM